MSRDLKFRAWNKVTEEMVTDEAVFIDTDGSIEVGGYSTIDEEGGAIVVMQYTGLKDKNGTDVYEGDIVTNENNIKFEIIWDNERFAWSARLDFTVLNCILKPDIFEVIGNIYEHPHILKREDRQHDN